MPIFMNTLEMDSISDGVMRAVIKVKHANMTPEEVYLFRSRMQAISSTGVLKSLKRGVQDLTKKEIERLTKVRRSELMSGGFFSETHIVTVDIKIPQRE